MLLGTSQLCVRLELSRAIPLPFPFVCFLWDASYAGKCCTPFFLCFCVDGSHREGRMDAKHPNQLSSCRRDSLREKDERAIRTQNPSHLVDKRSVLTNPLYMYIPPVALIRYMSSTVFFTSALATQLPRNFVSVCLSAYLMSFLPPSLNKLRHSP